MDRFSRTCLSDYVHRERVDHDERKDSVQNCSLSSVLHGRNDPLINIIKDFFSFLDHSRLRVHQLRSTR